MEALNTSFTLKVRYRTYARSYNLYAYFYSFHQKNERNPTIEKKKNKLPIVEGISTALALKLLKEKKILPCCPCSPKLPGMGH